ncbi:MAG: hypothetical protein J5833_05995 [Victivallales bacterium]|nr:hypothetical protein [Victivallales bacterium]
MAMNHHVTYRIDYDFCEDTAKWNLLKESLMRLEGTFDDVAFFDSTTCSVVELNETLRRLAVIEKRADEIRPFCKYLGVNHLCTMGHVTQNLGMAPKGFTPLTDLKGIVCHGTCCPNDEKFREEYLIPLFTAAGRMSFDFFWLDDDIRMYGHFPAKMVCFCKNCIAKFNHENGTDFTRETIATALNESVTQEKIALRKKWLEFSGRTIIGLFHLAETCIHAQNPKMQLGAMDGMHFADDNPYVAEAEALAGPNGPVPRWRPGGGAYTDISMLTEMVCEKSSCLGYVAAMLPDSVTDIESEIESYNQQRIRKSCRATQIEASIYAAAGCTGTAWNIICPCDSFSENNDGILNSAAAIRPFLDKLTDVCGRIRPHGVWPGCKSNIGAVFSLRHGTDWNDMAKQYPEPLFTEMFTGGIPVAYRQEDADMTMLIGDTALLFSDDELRQLFAGGVFCDGRTVQILEDRGLSELAGFAIERQFFGDAMECFVQYPMTEGLTELKRCCASCTPLLGDDGGFFILKPIDKDGKVLCNLVDYMGKPVADCSLGIYENSLGGRVAVSGFYPISNSLYHSRQIFMKRLFRWLSRDRLTAYLESYHRIAMWARPKKSICLVNASLDAAENAVLMVKDGAPTGGLFHIDSLEPITVIGEQCPDGYTRYRLPTLPLWTVAVLSF